MIDRFKLLLEDPRETLRRDPDIFDDFIPYVLSVVDSDPAAGKPLAHVIVKHAPTACQRVQGWGLWAQIHRAIGDLDEADRAIELALFFADDCRPCMADLRRRRAVLRRNRGQWDAAIEDADEAIRRYIELGHHGHDLDRNGLASCYNVRSQEWAKLAWLTAQVRYRLGKGRPYQLREMMEHAASDFQALGFPAESVAVASDLMKMKLAKRKWGQEQARDMCRDIVEGLLEGLPLTKLSAEIVAALHQVGAAAEECGWHAKDHLKASVDQLREACGPNMMACLLTWETT